MSQFKTITLAGISVAIPEQGYRPNGDLQTLDYNYTPSKVSDNKFFITGYGEDLVKLLYKNNSFVVSLRGDLAKIVYIKPTNTLVTTLDYSQELTELFSHFGVLAQKHGRGASHLLLSNTANCESIKLEVEAVKQQHATPAIPIPKEAVAEIIKQSYVVGVGRTLHRAVE